MKSLAAIPPLDLLAAGWLLAAWIGYTLVADGYSAHRRATLARVMHTHRRRWMDREMRMPDVNILIAHNRSAGLFCSTSLLIFIYAFFKFAWSLRQFNYALILIGGAPEKGTCSDEERSGYAERSAQVLSRAGGTFNRGIRAYYFGLATLVWFVQPVAFMVAVVWVLAVIYRRDYRSVTLSALADDSESTPTLPRGGSGY